MFVPDCLHLQLYRDSKDRYKQGQTKASLSLEHFLGLETGFTLDKESNTVAILCQDLVVVLAFDNRERLMQWQVNNISNFPNHQKLSSILLSVLGETEHSPERRPTFSGARFFGTSKVKVATRSGTFSRSRTRFLPDHWRTSQSRRTMAYQ